MPGVYVFQKIITNVYMKIINTRGELNELCTFVCSYRIQFAGRAV